MEREMEIELLLETCMFSGYVGEDNVPCANMPLTMSHDACMKMLDAVPAAPYAACWYTRDDGMMVFSLRSREDSNVDVSLVAEIYGGMGNKHAAGFATPVWPVTAIR